MVKHRPSMLLANHPGAACRGSLGRCPVGLTPSLNTASGGKDELCAGTLQGTAWKESHAEMVITRSLYYAQIEACLGKAAIENVTTEEQRTER